MHTMCAPRTLAARNAARASKNSNSLRPNRLDVGGQSPCGSPPLSGGRSAGAPRSLSSPGPTICAWRVTSEGDRQNPIAGRQFNKVN